MTQQTEPPYRGLTQRPDGTATLPAKTLARYKPTNRALRTLFIFTGAFGTWAMVLFGKLWGVPAIGAVVAFLFFVLWARWLQRRNVAAVRAIENSSVLIAQHEFAHAEQVLDGVATPYFSNAYYQALVVHNRAVIEMMRGNLDSALVLFLPLLKTAAMRNPVIPLNDPTHANMALAYALSDRTKEAREALAKINGKGTQSQQTIVNRTVCTARLRLGETKEVLALYSDQWNTWEHTLTMASLRVTALLRAFALSEQHPQDTRTPEQEQEIVQWVTYAGQPDRAATEYLFNHWPKFRAFVQARDVSFR